MTVTVLPQSRPLTADDLAAIPDDGHRYELIDGTLIVSPGPELRHQVVQAELLRHLYRRCPEDLIVMASPTDTVLADDTVVQPDALVVRRADLAGRRLTVTPLLVVEILSPSTQLYDLNLKKARHERAGVVSYWIVDPQPVRVQVFELRDGAYTEVADLREGDRWTATLPFEVTLRPSDLAG